VGVNKTISLFASSKYAKLFYIPQKITRKISLDLRKISLDYSSSKVAYLKSEEIDFVFIYFATNSMHTIILYKYPGQDIGTECNIDVTVLKLIVPYVPYTGTSLLAGRRIWIRRYPLFELQDPDPVYNIVQVLLDLKRLSQESETEEQ
jgi:hypothetical protein